MNNEVRELVVGGVRDLQERFYKNYVGSVEKLADSYLERFESGGVVVKGDVGLFVKRWVKKQLVIDRRGYAVDYENTLEGDLGKLRELVTIFVNKYQVRWNPHMLASREDLINGCMLRFIKGKFIEDYDSGMSMPEYYVKVGVRNYLISEERKASSRIKEVSGDDVLNDSGLTLFDLIDNGVVELSRDELLVGSIEEQLELEGRLSDCVVKEGDYVGQGLSYSLLFRLRLDGYRLKDLVSILGLKYRSILYLWSKVVDKCWDLGIKDIGMI